jgi:hypothetical protein
VKQFREIVIDVLEEIENALEDEDVDRQLVLEDAAEKLGKAIRG